MCVYVVLGAAAQDHGRGGCGGVVLVAGGVAGGGGDRGRQGLVQSYQY